MSPRATKLPSTDDILNMPSGPETEPPSNGSLSAESPPASEGPVNSVHAKLVRVMKAVGHVEKDGTNTFHNYKYVTEGAVVSAVRDALIREGVAFSLSVINHDVRERKTNAGVSFVTTLLCAATFTDADTGERETFTVVGAGDDPADKGVAKAMTMAKKYALTIGLLIATGDDPEADANTDARQNVASSAPRPAAAQQRPASPDKDAAMQELFTAMREAAKADVISPETLRFKGDQTGAQARAKMLTDILGRPVNGLGGLGPAEIMSVADILRQRIANKVAPAGDGWDPVAPPHTDADIPF